MASEGMRYYVGIHFLTTHQDFTGGPATTAPRLPLLLRAWIVIGLGMREAAGAIERDRFDDRLRGIADLLLHGVSSSSAS